MIPDDKYKKDQVENQPEFAKKNYQLKVLKKSKTHRSPTAIRCCHIAGAIEVAKIPDIMVDLGDDDDK